MAVLAWSPISDPVHTGGLERALRHGDADLAIGVFQIAGGRAGAQVHPFAHVAVAEEPIVRLIGIADDDRVGNLAAHLAHRADAGPGADQRLRQHLCLRADVARALNDAVGAEPRAIVQEHGAVRCIQHDARLDHKPAPNHTC